MVVFPENKPLIRNIHGSYVDMAKLTAYYQQKVDSGCIHLQGPNGEGVLFFNRQGVVNSCFSDQNRRLAGKVAQDVLLQPAVFGDMQIHVYEIPGEQETFWAQIHSATAIYTNLSTEFTDLVKLLKKMAAEKLTGYIDVDLGQPGEQGRIFLVEGKFIGGTYAWTADRLVSGKEDLETLIRKTTQAQGTFNVFRIASNVSGEEAVTVSEPETPSDGLDALAQLLALFEQMTSDSKTAKGDFTTCLKKKFMQQIDRFAFLDPFAAEFDYHDGAIDFRGTADEAQLVEGVLTALASLARELDLTRLLPEKVAPWKKRFADKYKQWHLADYFQVKG